MKNGRLWVLLLKQERLITAPCWYSWLLYSNLLATLIFIETPAFQGRLQNSRFFSKPLKKSQKRGVRVLHAWSMRASHAHRACREASKKNRLSVFHTISSFWPGSSKMSSSSQKSVHNSTLFMNLIHSVSDFEGEYTACYCLHLALNLDSVSSNSKAVFSVASLWNVVYKVEDQKWVEVDAHQQSLCLFLEGGVDRKSRALRIIYGTSKHS